MNKRDAVTKNLYDMAESFENVVKSFQNYSSSGNNNERQYKGILKYISKYGKNTVLHTWPIRSFTDDNVCYLVEQRLVPNEYNETVTCECPDFVYKKETLRPYECKHILKAKKNNQLDWSYGAGAIEAHRRLTEIANKALGNELEGKYKIEVKFTKSGWSQSSDLDGTYSKQEAQKAIDGHKNGLEYRMVPIEPKPEPLYKLEYNSSYLSPNTPPTWFSYITETFTKKAAQREIKKREAEHNWPGWLRMVPIDNN